MSKCLWSCCAALLILGSGLGATSSLAKPPDLPVDLGASFEDEDAMGGITVGLDLFTGKLSLSFTLPWQVLQSWFPDGMTGPNTPTSASGGRTNAACPPREARVGEEECEPATLRLDQARAMFEIAERCRKKGDLDKARTCYEEAHLLAPETRVGRQAIERLADIDSSRTSQGSAEPQPAVGRSRN